MIPLMIMIVTLTFVLGGSVRRSTKVMVLLTALIVLSVQG